MTINIICPCGKQIITSPSRINRKKYCSKDCFYKYRTKTRKGVKNKLPNNNPTSFKKGHVPANKGITPSTELINNLKIKLKGVRTSPETEFKKGQNTGSKNCRWKGGITPLNRSIRGCSNNKAWIKSVFKRDNYTCQNCGKVGVVLQAHHIKSFVIIMEEYNIQTLDDAKNCKELWDISNGLTLCKECHLDE